MSTSALRLEQKAVKAEELILALKQQIKEARQSSLQQEYNKETQDLEQENEVLRLEVNNLKNRLVDLETRRGIKQITLPGQIPIPLTIPIGTPFKQGPSAIPVPIQKGKQPSPVPQDGSKEAKVSDKKVKEKKKPEAATTTKKPAEDDFPVDVSRLDFRIGKIMSVKKHPDADSLYVEEVDVGENKNRTVCSGLVKHLGLEDLHGKTVVLLCNLKAAKMRGIVSEAMVMCASTPEKVEVLIPPSGSKPGERVQFEGFPSKPDAELNPKKKIFEQIAPDLKTDDNKVATYKGVPFTIAGKGVVVAQTLANAPVK